MKIFDLEQQFMACWQLIDDIQLLADENASPEEFAMLAAVYKYKFDRTWNTFEDVCKEFHLLRNSTR